MLALVNAELDTITNGRIARGVLLVEDGKIVAVGPDITVPKEAEVVDAGGRLVTPGLIEAHSHAGLTEDGFLEDSDHNEKNDPVTPQVLAIDAFKPTDIAMAEGAAAGITTMYMTQGSSNVFCGIGAIVKTWAPTVAEQIVATEAGMKMALGENPKNLYGGKGQSPSTRMGVAAMIRKTFLDARHYLALKDANQKKPADTREPFATDMKLEAVARLLKGEFPARCHAHRAADMLTFMRIADEFGFRFVFEHATEAIDILDELKKRDVSVVVGPTMGKRGKVETRHKSFETVARAFEAGLTVAITSDHGITPMKNLAVYAALAVREGLSNEDAMKALTINPAKIIGVADRLGSLEAGKDADIVVWDGDPLDARTKPWRVYIGGMLFDEARARLIA